ncbi:uncharacterized protein LOC124653866 [Lolium rigidum]|uniref:uncharacterized protein LOC124653866 n=1 Tax=Lolium rigidum TaxID=89674 RepID=UPI001F5C9958|nr:uncharacterized protein LOC124653866 [Lolium rigidum]
MADTVNGRFLSGASRRRVLNAVLLGGALHGLIWHLVSLDPHSEFLNAVGILNQRYLYRISFLSNVYTGGHEKCRSNSWEERNIDVSRATKIKLSIYFLVSELSPGDTATSITTQHRHLHQAILPVDRSRALSHLATYLWLSVAVVLDPRYKMRFLEHCFKQAYGNGAKTYISDVRGKIYELFFRYSCRADEPSRNNNGMEMNTHVSDPLDFTDQNYHEQATYDDSLRELHAYLDGQLYSPNDVNYLSREALSQDGHFDILKWWKANASIYPVLAAVARDVLTISGSGVSEQSAFDETDERVYLFNQKLSHEMAEAVICTQDWFQDSEPDHLVTEFYSSWGTETSDADGGNSTVPI